MSDSSNSERFHALDATRAFALLLGVVFHAAWSFVPTATGAPIVDVIYLVHLPLVAALRIWMAPWPWPGVVKFLLLNLAAFTVLIASYHCLVRSTFIGRVLNGRSHPFVAWPLVANTAFASAANTTPANPGTQTP